MSIYACSDIHSHITAFKKGLPNNISKLYILGDIFNKGIEQRQTVRWVLENKDNPKIKLILGNHELRMMAELHRYYNISDPLFKEVGRIWISKKNRTPDQFISGTKVIIKLIENKVYTLEHITDMFNSFSWFEEQKVGDHTWFLSHASWVPFVTDVNSLKFKKNCAYDFIRLADMLRNKTVPEIQKYVSYCQKNKIFHVFGHIPTTSYAGVNPPLILQKNFFYIDSDTNRTNRVFFFKLF